MATDPEIMSRVLGIVYRLIEIHLIQQAGCTPANAKTGVVTLIQRFGSATNLNIHFHFPAASCGRNALMSFAIARQRLGGSRCAGSVGRQIWI